MGKRADNKRRNREAAERHLDRVTARQAVAFEVWIGNWSPVSQLSCEICGAQAVARHHHNGWGLAHRLDVLVVCSKCHVKLDKKKRNEDAIALSRRQRLAA